jgi:branched-chain amino acid transport system permease protein
MSTVWLPCGHYHENYVQDQGWWQTPVLKLKMLLLLAVVFVLIPLLLPEYWVGVGTMIGYTAMGALGVQLLIGFGGLITLGHAAFIAVGAYTSALLVLEFPWPAFMIDWGLAYPASIVVAGLFAGIWSVVFGLPCARVKGFYLILTTIAAQFITVDFILTQYVSKIGGRAQAFSLPPGTIQIGPWSMDTEIETYYFMAILVTGMIVVLANLLRSKPGRAWVAIRDNDIAASTMGINVYRYKILAFFVAGAMAGVAGAFWLSNTAALSPEHFTWFWSLWLVGVILIGGVGSIHGAIFGSIFMVLVMEFLQMGVIPLAAYYPKLLMNFAFLKEAFFGLIICVFLIFEPHGLAYRWWQMKNYFNLWPFSY